MTELKLERLRPEVGAGGYTEDDDGVAFYQRIDALIRPNMNVLDFGAGRSASTDGRSPQEVAVESYAYRLRYMKGRVARITGVDIDPQVLENPTLDDAMVLSPGQTYPFADQSFDLVFADWVVEHIDNVDLFSSEMYRLVKPKGWFCARTLNRWSYVAIAARILGERTERYILRWLQPWRKDQDAFPKFYRLNTLGAIKSAFPDDQWINCTYRFNSMPRYHGNRTWIFRALDFYQRVAPRPLTTTLMIFLQKR
jgi:SAM-dependent methyltransferase